MAFFFQAQRVAKKPGVSKKILPLSLQNEKPAKLNIIPGLESSGWIQVESRCLTTLKR